MQQRTKENINILLMQGADKYPELKSWGGFSVTPFDNVDQIVTVKRHVGRRLHCGNTNTDVKQQIRLD